MTHTQSNFRRFSFWQVLLYAALSRLFFRGRSGSTERSHRPASENHRCPAPKSRAATGGFGFTRSNNEPRHIQDERACEPGRSRRAKKPWQIPWTDWKDILWRTYQQLSEDRLVAVAAGVVFYALLAVFPAITALVSLYGLFADPGTISQHLSLAAGILPKGGLDIVQDQINRLTSKGNATLGFGFIFGLVIALWSANAGMKALMDALNVVFNEKEQRGFVWLNLISLTLTVAAIVSMLFAIAAVVVLPLLLNFIGLGGMSEMLLQVLRWPALLILVITGLTILYRFGPSRTKPRWEWLSVGTIFAAVA